MKTFLKATALKFVLITAIFMALFAVSAQTAEAAAPVLNLSNAGNSQVRIEVTGDINVPVYLYYYNPPNSGSIQSAGVIGNTNSSGYFETTVGNNAYGIPTGTTVFVNVNNQQSSSVTWPTITGGNVYISQSSVSLYAGQNTTVSISGGTGSYYISTNSNSNVATASINGSIITVNAVNSGNTTLTICSASAGTSCVTLNVNVNGYSGNNQSLSFNPTSVNVQTGQVQSVNVYGSGSYYVSGNSNSSVASVTMNGSVLNVTGIANGSTTFTICSQSSNNTCASLYVTVYTSYNNNGYYNGNNNNYPNNYYPYNNQTYYNTQPVVYYDQPVVYSQPTIIRSQSYGQPVSGVYLNQLPATGISFGLKVTLFLIGLMLWSAAIAYFIILPRTNSRSRNVSVVGGSGLTKAEAFKMNQIRMKGGR